MKTTLTEKLDSRQLKNLKTIKELKKDEAEEIINKSRQDAENRLNTLKKFNNKGEGQ